MEEKEKNEKQETPENLADNITVDATNKQVGEMNEQSEGQGTANLSEQLAQLQDSHLRLMAEYDNYRKRTIKEKADLIKGGGEKVLIGLLPVLDDFQRAIQTISGSTDVSAVSEGVSLIYNKFISFLNQNGVKQIEAVSQPFNEELFDAVAVIPASTDDVKGTVIECVQTGYLLNDKVIRHAKVVVAE